MRRYKGRHCEGQPTKPSQRTSSPNATMSRHAQIVIPSITLDQAAIARLRRAILDLSR